MFVYVGWGKDYTAFFKAYIKVQYSQVSWNILEHYLMAQGQA